jgi:hypothetical protein
LACPHQDVAQFGIGLNDTISKSATVTTNDPHQPTFILKLRAMFEVVE